MIPYLSKAAPSHLQKQKRMKFTENIAEVCSSMRLASF